ncbi:MAG: chitooligosaccharide deacetylase [Chitinophagaceae bacterium]|nr:MAG: chitooligosaccharide deacetylase [Chitinophagaceae bacterium]
MKTLSLLFLLLCYASISKAQTVDTWNAKKCAVVLTHDDSIDGHLDLVIPALDSLKLKGTFYLIGSSPAVSNRISEWRLAAKNGHELGNHTLNHPCDGTLPGRSFVNSETDLSKYTLARALKEIRINNTLLKAIDGKSKRTFAFPCGDLNVQGVNFYDQVKNEFSGARGVNSGFETLATANTSNIKTYSINGQSAQYMIDLVKEAQRNHTLVVFLFHGVGGGHALNVDLTSYRELLKYLKDSEKEIWVAPLVDVVQFIKAKQSSN